MSEVFEGSLTELLKDDREIKPTDLSKELSGGTKDFDNSLEKLLDIKLEDREIKGRVIIE